MNYKTFALAVLVALALVLCAVACDVACDGEVPTPESVGGG